MLLVVGDDLLCRRDEVGIFVLENLSSEGTIELLLGFAPRCVWDPEVEERRGFAGLEKRALSGEG